MGMEMMKGLEHLSSQEWLRGKTLHSKEDSGDLIYVYKYLVEGNEGVDSSPSCQMTRQEAMDTNKT